MKNYVSNFFEEIDPWVFGIGFGVTAILVAFSIIRTEVARETIHALNDFLWFNFAWAYLLLFFAMVIFCFYLIIGRWGSIKLGKEDEEPEYSFYSYFAMLYSAAIAAGIVFYGPAEAIMHLDTPSPFLATEPMSVQAAIAAVKYTFFHWGFSAWSVYMIVALPIAYYAFKYGSPIRVSTILAPWLGKSKDDLEDWKAKTIDILSVFATVGGVATTLGLVGDQFITGLQYLFGIQLGDPGVIIMVTGLTVAFTLSVALGIDKGIKVISNFNLTLFFTLMILVFIIGPSFYILNMSTEALGRYLIQFVPLSLYTNVAGRAPEWFVGAWTIFYWAWWMSWAPFVGLFIARISRGRTVRQVVGTGFVASTGITIPWFGVMGATACNLQLNDVVNLVPLVNQYGEAVAGYPLLKALPWIGGVLTLGFLTLVLTFFITSADSSTLALGMLTTGGKEEPSTINRVVWGGLIGLTASILMTMGGTIIVQSSAIFGGTLFGIPIVIAFITLIKEFRSEKPIFGEE